jgi:hypothetical protein
LPKSITIPADISGVLYFLGGCLDVANTPLETFENNNYLAHPRSIVVSARPAGAAADLSVFQWKT